MTEAQEKEMKEFFLSDLVIKLKHFESYLDFNNTDLLSSYAGIYKAIAHFCNEMAKIKEMH